MSHPEPLNPYAPPQLASDETQRVVRLVAELPPRGPTLWVATVIVLLGSMIIASLAVYLLGVWFELIPPTRLGLDPTSKSFEPIGAASLNLLLVSVVMSFGQVRSVLFGDRVWSRMVAWGLLLGAGILFVGSYFLSRGEITDVLLITPAVLMLWLGIVMYRWYLVLLEVFRKQQRVLRESRKPE